MATLFAWSLFFYVCDKILYVEIGHHNGSAVVVDLKGQHATLRDCIEQLTSVELSRANLVANLREALQEQVC